MGRGLTVKAGLAAVPAGRPVGPLERGDRRPSTQTWDEPLWGGVVPSAEKQLPPRALPVSHQPAVYRPSDRRGSQLLVRVTQSHSQKRN